MERATRLARSAAAPRHAHGHQNVPPARFSRCARALSSLVLRCIIPKRNTILSDGVSFCDCPQVLLSALPPTARKGECEGGTFDGFPHSRSIARPQATDFAQQNRRSKKIRPPFGWSYFFGAGDEARTRYLDLGKVALYQMSYARKRRRCCGTLVPPVGVEPTTRGFSVRCSTN